METATTDLLSAIQAYSRRHDTAMLAQQTKLLNERDVQSYTALALLTVLCSQVPEMSVLLGNRYEQGYGVRKDQDKALMSYRRATENGNSDGEYALGWHYYEQDDYVRAIEHFENCLRGETKLTDDMLMQSHACTGDAYSKLANPNYGRAIEHLAIAADRYHSIFANRRLGFIFCDTGNHQYDIQKSLRYLGVAADNGDVISAHQLAVIYLYGDTRKEISPNGYMAERVLLPFANSDDEDIIHDLGVLYFYGDEENGLSKDYDKSKRFYERLWALRKTGRVAANLGYLYFSLEDYIKAAELLAYADKEGDNDYSDFLGRIHLKGLLGSPDKRKAAYYYGRAFDAGSINNFFTCKEYLSVLYDLGDYSKAYDVAEFGIKEYNDIEFYYQKSRLVLQGKVDRMSLEDAASIMDEVRGYDGYQEEACYELGHYFNSVGRFTRAIQYFSMAFDFGMADAGVYIARIYEHGGGSVQRSIAEARRWYARAANAGSKLRQ